MLSISALGSENRFELSPKTFGQDFNEALVHQVVVAHMAAARSGTKAQKTRAEVSGGGRKPWKQKGTGNARAGSIRSPLWRKGGVVFAAKPRDFSKKVNRKMYRGAMRSILSELLRQGRLLAVESIAIEQPKTRSLLALLKSWGLEQVLIVTKHWDASLYLASRNVPHVEVCQSASVDPVRLVKYSKVVMTVDAVRELEEVLA